MDLNHQRLSAFFGLSSTPFTMDRRDSPKRIGAGASKSKAAVPTQSTRPAVEAPAGGSHSRVPTVTAAGVHLIAEEHAIFFANKVVIGFEEEFTIYRAKSWIRSYNQATGLKLEIFHEFPNALFVVQIDSVDVPAAKSALLSASPLGVGEIYASVNDYNIAFDPCNQRDFRHLVTVNIPRGNPAIFSLIKCFIHIVDTYVKGVLGPDLRHISVIVESKLKLFPAHGRFQLPGSDITTIFFDYEGRNLRCCYCFSYRHFPTNCKEPRPPLFYSPELQVDPIRAEDTNGIVTGSGGHPEEPRVQLPGPATVLGASRLEQGEPPSAIRRAKSKRGRPRDKHSNLGEVPFASGGAPKDSFGGVLSESYAHPRETAQPDPDLSSVGGASIPCAPHDNADTHMLSEPSPAHGVPSAALIFSSTAPQPPNKDIASSSTSARAALSGSLPSPLSAFDKVTTRKRDRAGDEVYSGLFQNLNVAFSLESPRPFKRIQRPTSQAGTADTKETAGIDNGAVEISFLQYERAGLSPATSERSSAAGEPAGSA